MRTVDHALFVDDGNALITNVSNRVEKHRLRRNSKGELKPEKLWSTKISYCSSVIEAPDQDRVIATDTSGAHFGLTLTTGEIRWRKVPVGEGDAAVITSRSTFLFSNWQGVLQELDPEDGREVSAPIRYASKLRRLQINSDKSQISALCLIPAKSDDDPVGQTLCTLDLGTNRLREIVPNTFSDDMTLSPDGSRLLSIYFVDAPSGETVQRCVVNDIKTSETLSERTLAIGQFVSRFAAWSPDGNIIASACHDGHIFLSCDDLSTIAFVPGRFANQPAFHPASTDVCLCRKNDSKIVPVDRLPTLSAPKI